MNRSYSLFVTDDELLSSPYVRRFNYLHDLTLHLGKKETVNFLLQTSLSNYQQKHLKLSYDSSSVEVHSVATISYQRQTLITVSLTPRELGTIRIGFTYPEERPAPAKTWLRGRKNALRPKYAFRPRPTH
jgi:hypothetical protein